MKHAIFLARTERDSYTKVTLAEGAVANIGCIERDGHLNVKLQLRDMIALAGGDFAQTPEYQEATDGKTHGVGGTGYHSHAKFLDPEEAKRYLERYFEVSGEV